MKILAIRIRNLASLEGNTEIDFTSEPLLSAGIFAITGPTGAGKSTILDAVCLALYARTPRYAQAQEMGIALKDISGQTIAQNDIKSILRDGTAEGYAEVDFVGADGKKYRSRWQVRRARNRPDGALQQDTITLINLTDEQPIPGKKQEILKQLQQITGLSFDQFTRSVLLAQGEFTAFLKAGKDEKASLLEKLTGTEIYSAISQTVYENAARETQALQELEIQLKQIELLSEEEREQLNTQKVEKDHAYHELQQKHTSLTNEIQWYQTMHKLQNEVNKALLHWNEKKDIQQQIAPDRALLQKIQSIQPLRNYIDALDRVALQLRLTKEKHTQLDQQLKSYSQQEQELQLQYQQAENEAKAAENEWNEAIPLLREASVLDSIIAEKKQALEGLSKETEALQNSLSQHQIAIQSHQSDWELCQQKITSCKQWLQIHENKKQILAHESEVLAGLSEANHRMQTLQKLELAQKETEKQLHDTRSEWNQIKDELDKKQQTLQELTRVCAEQASILQTWDVDVMEKDKNKLDQTLLDIYQAKSFWNQYLHLITEIRNHTDELTEQQDELQQISVQLQQANEKLYDLKIKKETSSQMVDRLRMEHAKDIKLLRENLLLGEPCPVCGSTHHPYQSQHSSAESMLDTLEQAHKEVEDQYSFQLSLVATQTERSENLQQRIQVLTQKLNAQHAEMLTHQEQEPQTAVWKEMMIQDEDSRTEWLSQKVQQLKDAQENLKKKLEVYEQQKVDWEEKIKLRDQAEKECMIFLEKKKDIERILTSREEAWQKLCEEQKELQYEVDAKLMTVAKWFVGEDWKLKWKENPTDFISKLQQFILQWKEAEKQITLAEQKAMILQEKITALRDQSKQLTDSIQKKKAQIQHSKEDIQKQEQQRKELFQGASTLLVQHTLQEKLQQTKEQKEKKYQHWESLKQQILQTQTQARQYIQDITTFSSEKEKLLDTIQVWLEKYGESTQIKLTLDEARNLLQYDYSWIQQETARIQSIDEQATIAYAAYHDRLQRLSEHQQKPHTESSLEALQLEEKTIQQAIQRALESISNIRYKLQTDSANREKAQALLKTIEQKSIHAIAWQKLNEVIGSADGKKFRQAVQEYTLDILLDYANAHLESLSGRYVLERVPDSLGLQVVDQYMGNEIRTVYSLSGGESFLVSLSLALALASLSSEKMNVESLFIDEGFGVLDPNTLHIAMDVLERLHYQGRKVGVISHVEEMTERIPVRIQVNRLASGRSEVKVASFL